MEELFRNYGGVRTGCVMSLWIFSMEVDGVIKNVNVDGESIWRDIFKRGEGMVIVWPVVWRQLSIYV